MKKYLLCVVFGFIWYEGKTQTLTKDQKDIITERIQGFNAAFKQYSGVRGGTDSTLYSKILEYKDGDDPQQGVANDLFYSQNVQSIHFLDYLDKIDDVYHHQLDVAYDDDNMKILDCIQTKHTNSGDLPFAFVSVNKTLTYGNQKKEVTEVIAINLNNYKIPDVFFPGDSVYNKGVCNTEITSLNTANLSPVINVKLGKYKNAIKQADKWFSSGDYQLAKNQYEQIISEFPTESQKNNIAAKLNSCADAINNQSYVKMMGYGNYYYSKGIFNKAIEFYGYALQYKPNDGEALAGIERSKNNTNPRIVKDGINNAEQLAAADQNNYGKAFRILSDLEPSGMLSTRNYYFMIENLYQRNPVVMTEMGYTDEDCESYLNIYRYKLRLAGDREKQTAVRNDVLLLLGDIVLSSARSHTYVRRVNYYPTWVIHNRLNRPIVINPNRSGYSIIRTNNPYRRVLNSPGIRNNVPFTHGGNNQPVNVPGRFAKPTLPVNNLQRPQISNQVKNGAAAPQVKRPSFFKRLGSQVINNPKINKNPVTKKVAEKNPRKH